MNKIEVSTKQLSLKFEARDYGNPELRGPLKKFENGINHDKYISRPLNAGSMKPMPRRKLKEFVLGMIFLVALCFAVLDSNDLSIFVLTKIGAFLIFVLAYSEYKSLWNRKGGVSRRGTSFRERRRKLKVDAMGFFEERNPIAYSVLYEPRSSYKRLCFSEVGGATWSKWTH